MELLRNYCRSEKLVSASECIDPSAQKPRLMMTKLKSFVARENSRSVTLAALYSYLASAWLDPLTLEPFT